MNSFFKKQIDKNLRSKIDIIVTSGAVSAGKHEFYPLCSKKILIYQIFSKGWLLDRVNQFYLLNLKEVKRLSLGLPGNPISSSACFRFFVYSLYFKYPWS